VMPPNTPQRSRDARTITVPSCCRTTVADPPQPFVT
jgi:hypothetical protein